MRAVKRNQLKGRVLKYPHMDILHPAEFLFHGKEILQKDIGNIQTQRYYYMRSTYGYFLDQIGYAVLDICCRRPLFLCYFPPFFTPGCTLYQVGYIGVLFQRQLHFIKDVPYKLA